MKQTRDRWVAAAAIAVLALLAAIIVGLMLDAQRAGIETREDFRLEQVRQLANSMDTRIQQIYRSLAATVGAPGSWTMVPGDPADAAKLRPTSPQATTGNLLVDQDGVLVNGSLLRDPSLIGTRYERDGLDLVLGGEATLFSVAPGLTTTESVLGVAIPLHAADGTLAGAYIIEAEATAGSAFSQEVAQLRAGETGVFSFVDPQRRVAASSDETTLARPVQVPADGLRTGFHRLGRIVTATAEVPAARWRLVFQQSTDEFEGDVTGPVRSALLLLLLVAVVGGGVSVVALLRRLRAAREEQRRLADISAAREEFTSIVSHELRTPVAGLLGFLQTTVDHWDEMADDQRRQAVGRAQQNAERLQHLTTEMLDTTSLEAGQLQFHTESTDLRPAVTQAVETIRDAHDGRDIRLELPDEPVLVVVDLVRLHQVVTNLLDNAMKSSPFDAPVEVAVRAEGNTATVTVRDHGSGVAPGDRERIFEKFTSGRNGLTRGSGLGLYLAREIIGAHGGRIWVGDTDGPGATVAFTLPTKSGDRVRG
ncbi:MAG: kdpD [Acidimicrobiales bacterium]|nr:kdpD [Acidimicrobiales bacterium]